MKVKWNHFLLVFMFKQSKNAFTVFDLDNFLDLGFDLVDSIEIDHFIHPEIGGFADNLHHFRAADNNINELGKQVWAHFLRFTIQFRQRAKQQVIFLILRWWCE